MGGVVREENKLLWKLRGCYGNAKDASSHLPSVINP